MFEGMNANWEVSASRLLGKTCLMLASTVIYFITKEKEMKRGSSVNALTGKSFDRKLLFQKKVQRDLTL